MSSNRSSIRHIRNSQRTKSSRWTRYSTCSCSWSMSAPALQRWSHSHWVYILILVVSIVKKDLGVSKRSSITHGVRVGGCYIRTINKEIVLSIFKWRGLLFMIHVWKSISIVGSKRTESAAEWRSHCVGSSYFLKSIHWIEENHTSFRLEPP